MCIRDSIDGDILIDCPTLGDAVVALDNLPEPRKSVATIKVKAMNIGGRYHERSR